MGDLAQLRERWTYLYRDYLPALAKAKDPVQKRWSVNLDHCFARIVLDNAIGQDRPWTEVVGQPAVKNMSEKQLQVTIELAESIATGEASLDQLNQKSLEFRGKKRKAKDDSDSNTVKKQRNNGTVSSYFMLSPTSRKQRTPLTEKEDSENTKKEHITPTKEAEEVDMSVQVKRIEESDITAFRKQMLILLCQIPRGRYSTYKEMSDFITRTSHKTCARAVGNAMRNNPFAPEVPCHRVLAHDGSLGGFCGHWGENGKFASEKHRLLHEEGVRFDSRGKVKGPPFRGFAT